MESIFKKYVENKDRKKIITINRFAASLNSLVTIHQLQLLEKCPKLMYKEM